MNEKTRQETNELRNSPSKAKWILSGLLALAVLSIYYLIKGPTKRLTMTHAEWDEFIKLHPYEAPSLGASRSPCPFLNTFSNHGILPRTGRNVTYDDYYRALTLAGVSHQSSSLFLHTVFYAYKEIDPTQPIKSDWTPATSISLHQLGQHNMLEHDLSLSRLDVSKQPDFTIPNSDLVLSLMAMADQTSNMVGEEQVGDFRRKKWIEAIATQSNYHFGLPYQFTGGFECLLLLDFLGHDHQISANHLESFLLKERIPDDWYPMEKPLPAWTIYKRVKSCIKSVRKSNS